MWVFGNEKCFKGYVRFIYVAQTLLSSVQFLSGLLIKFRNASNGMIASASGESTFAMQVAESISKCVQSSDEFLKSECPICLEEPRVEDAVYSEWADFTNNFVRCLTSLSNLLSRHSSMRSHVLQRMFTICLSRADDPFEEYKCNKCTCRSRRR